jgi:hypothetical protein
MKKLIAVMLLLVGFGLAQDKSNENPQDKLALYKFDFTISEVQNGKKTNVRNYTMFLKEGRGEQRSVRVGNRIPIATGKDTFQYLDVGFNLDCHFSAADGGALLGYNFDLSSLLPGDSSTSPATSGQPVVRSMRQEGSAYVPNGKPTLIASMDDINTARTVQLEVVATRIK